MAVREQKGRRQRGRGSERQVADPLSAANGGAKTWGKPDGGRASQRVLAKLLRKESAAGADLRFLWFCSWDLSGVDLRHANLEGANLSQADLSDADLRGANLRSTKLLGAKLRGAMLDGASLSGALVHGADFTAVQGLSTEQTAALGRSGAVMGCSTVKDDHGR